MPSTIPTDDEIRLRAYHLWELNGRQDGRELDYWLQAALELEDISAGRPVDIAPAFPGTLMPRTLPTAAANLDQPAGGGLRRSA